MTKNGLIDAVSLATGLPRTQVMGVIEASFEAMIESLAKGERVEFRNFGIFFTKVRKPKTAHNPRTKKKVHVPAKRVVSFRPGKEMKSRVK